MKEPLKIGASLDFVYAGLLGQVSDLKTHSIMEYERTVALRKIICGYRNSWRYLKGSVEQRISRDRSTSYINRF